VGGNRREFAQGGLGGTGRVRKISLGIKQLGDGGKGNRGRGERIEKGKQGG